MKKTIRQYRSKVGFHGYQEWYRNSNETRIWFRGMFEHNQINGYVEWHRLLLKDSCCMYHIR